MFIKCSGLQPIRVTSITAFAPTGAAEETTITTEADSGGSLDGTWYTLNSANDINKYYVYHNFAAVAEVTDLQYVADVNGSLNGKYHYLYDGNNNPFYVWFSTGTAEVTTITAEADVEGSLSGKYLRLFSQSGNEYYVWFQLSAVAEVSTVTAEADSSDSLDGTYWTFDDGTTNYHVWYNTSGGSAVDPEPGGSTGIEVAINTNDVANDVATATRTAISGSAALVSVGGTGADIEITNDNTGFVDDTADGDTGWSSFVTDVEGSTASTNPAPDGILVSPPTSVPIAITADMTANNIATAMRSAIGGLSDFSTGGSSASVVVTDANLGAVRDAEDGNTSWTIVTSTAGVDTATDPKLSPFTQIPSSATGLQVAISANATASAVATAASTVIDARAEFGASPSTDTVTVTNATAGSCTNASDGELVTGVTPTVTTPGRDATLDPVKIATNRQYLLGRTAIPVSVTVGDSANTIATASRAAIGAKSDFNTSGATDQLVITNAANGDTTNTADGVGSGATGWSIVETTAGATAIPSDLKLYKIVGTITSHTESWQGAGLASNSNNYYVNTPGKTNAVTIIVPEKRIEYVVEADQT